MVLSHKFQILNNQYIYIYEWKKEYVHYNLQIFLTSPSFNPTQMKFQFF
jgi:hypothetical protein